MKELCFTLLIFSIGGLILAQTSTPDDEAAKRRAQLESIKTELEQKRAAYDSLGRKERSEGVKLRDLEQQTALSGQLLRKIEKQQTFLRGSITEQKLKLQINRVQREARQEILKKRLRHIYMLGDRPDWFEILATGDISSGLVAYKNLKALLEYDRHLIASFHELSVNLESGLRKYQADVSSLDELQADQQKELEKRERTLKTRKKLVEKLKRDKGEVRKSISQLEEDARDVAGILEALELQARQGPSDSTLLGLAGSRGNLIWPARGRIMRQFGLITDKRGISISNPGIDIGARAGADVVAAASGKVIYVSWLRGYGQFIIVDHGLGYYTLYANLSEVMVDAGEKVMAGELIGTVGDTGSLEGPKLHFEVRYRKEQLNPMDWLR